MSLRILQHGSAFSALMVLANTLPAASTTLRALLTLLQRLGRTTSPMLPRPLHAAHAATLKTLLGLGSCLSLGQRSLRPVLINYHLFDESNNRETEMRASEVGHRKEETKYQELYHPSLGTACW